MTSRATDEPQILTSSYSPSTVLRIACYGNLCRRGNCESLLPHTTCAGGAGIFPHDNRFFPPASPRWSILSPPGSSSSLIIPQRRTAMVVTKSSRYVQRLRGRTSVIHLLYRNSKAY